MQIPNFFLVGAPKSATTAKNHILGQHPEIFVGRKEMHHFALDLDSEERVDDFSFVRERAAYLSHFAGVDKEHRIGEASVFYLYSQEVAARIHEFNPKARIIIMLREPVEMMYALHAQFLSTGTEDIESFDEALRAEDERHAGKRKTKNGWTHKCLFYRDVARYGEQVERFLCEFGPEQVMIIAYDDFVRDQAQVFRNTLRFLEVDDSFVPQFKVLNASKRVRSKRLNDFLCQGPLSVRSPLVRVMARMFPPSLRRRVIGSLWGFNLAEQARPPLSAALRRQLECEVAPDIEHLSRFSGRDFSALWRLSRSHAVANATTTEDLPIPN